jgi:alpha-D-ribose 1-methylphosphonate 5-triphosphate synthase subunit PhnI
MGYRPVKGGAAAIRAASSLVHQLEVDDGQARIEVAQIQRQLGAAVDRVMGEGGLYAPELAALALKQAEGDAAEAALLLRAYRSTLPRLGYALPVGGRAMRVRRRISSAFKDVPGGQLLGRTRDYTHRLLDFSQLAGGGSNGALGVSPDGASGGAQGPAPEHGGDGAETAGTNGALHPAGDGSGGWAHFPKVSETLRAAGIMPRQPQTAEDGAQPFDITRESLRHPVSRPAWLQALARGETGAMVCLAYSNLRGYGFADHGTIGELRVGDLPLRVVHPLTGQPVTVGWYRATEVEMFGPEASAPAAHQGRRPAGRLLANYGMSYGLVIGEQERKAIAMSLLDSALLAAASIEGEISPSNDQEMVLSHVDGIESSGFVEHLKLPHYVTFGSELRTLGAPLGAAPASSAASSPAEDGQRSPTALPPGRGCAAESA